MSFLVSTVSPEGENDEVGICKGQLQPEGSQHSKQSESRDMFSKRSRKFGIPVTSLSKFRESWGSSRKEATLIIAIRPLLDDINDAWCLEGEMAIHVNEDILSSTKSYRVDVECRPRMKALKLEATSPRDLYPFHLRAIVSIRLVDNLHPSIDIMLEPRAVVVNDMPIPLILKSPMPHIFASKGQFDGSGHDDHCYELQEDTTIEIFTPGPSIALDIRIKDSPVGGTTTEWMDEGWIELPLSAAFRLTEPLRCKFGAAPKGSMPSLAACEFFIAQGTEQKSNLFSASKVEPADDGIEVSVETDDVQIGTFYITVGNYAIDHSGDLLIERVAQNEIEKGNSRRDRERLDGSSASPLGAYANESYVGRLSLLPGPKDLIRLLHLTMEGATGFKRSVAFAVEDLAICNGGFESTPIFFEDGNPAGFFAYRQLVKSYQSEIHLIPEFVVFNGSTKYCAVVRQEGASAIVIDPGKIAPFHPYSRKRTMITVQYPELEGESDAIRVDSHGMHLAIISSSQGMAIGSFAVQTVVGNRDSRWVIKLGDVKFSSLGKTNSGTKRGLLEGDFLRFRVRWTELQVTLNEARPISDGSKAILESAIDNFNNATSPRRGLNRGTTW